MIDAALTYFLIGFVLTAVQFVRLLEADDLRNAKDVRSVLISFLIGVLFWPILVVILFYTDREDM